ncbi:alginate export family protein [Sphingomonas sp. NFX23]|uniref:alginate export family protein n=1 Tax=Sphingomonas sp. NFX23 TaxID=2819532 RepID=UPI003CF12821
MKTLIEAVLLGAALQAVPVATAQTLEVRDGKIPAKPDPARRPLNVPNSVLPSSFAFQPLPYDEDYTRMADPTLRNNTWARLKNIPVIDDVYLTVGGELRGRIEARHNLNFGRGPEDEGLYPQYRARVWTDVHLSDSVRVFSEIQSSGTTGRLHQYGAIDDNGTDLHQAFVEFKRPLGGGSLTVRGGRQEISFGKARIFDTRNGPNTRRAYDAGRLIWAQGAWRAGAFGGAVVQEVLGSWKDRTNDGFTFFGGNVARKLDGWFAGSELEALFVHTDREAGAPTYVGKRDTLSLRLAGRKGKLDYDAEFVGQRGRSQIGQVKAWYTGLDAAYQLPGRLSPRVGVRADVGSGDSHPGNGTDGTYDYLGSRGMTLTAELGFSNLVAVGPTFGLKPSRTVTAELTFSELRRMTRADGLYSMTSALIRRADEGSSKQVGVRATGRIDHQWNRFLLSGLYFAYIDADRFLKETGDGKDLAYAALYTVVRL